MKERKQKVTKSLRLSEEIIEKINNFSQRTGLSQTKIITSAIENFLSNKGVENE